MKGARRYAKLFKTGQYGRLYIVSGGHARGLTFHVYVLPAGVDAIPNGANNGPLNRDAVEVYGINSGQPGWTESYGWLHSGPWQSDLETLADARAEELASKQLAITAEEKTRLSAKTERELALLAKY